MGRILLFYKYVTLDDPQQILAWQRTICQGLGLTGRIILATEGINGTVGGTTQATEAYKAIMSMHPLFGGIDFKEAEGGAEDFPRLRVVVKSEIVHLGIDPQQCKATDGGAHLKPAQAHELMASKPDDLVILDARNAYESRIGTFTGSLTPQIDNFRELPEYIDQNLEQFKDKQVLMHCTGGIRCERASAYLKSKGVAKEVYQIEGGIDRYIEQYPDGFFRGKNYVFDGRTAVKANDDILTTCDLCGIAYDTYANCMNAQCNKQFIGCNACLEQLKSCCGQACYDLVMAGAVVIRKEATKTSSKRVMRKRERYVQWVTQRVS